MNSKPILFSGEMVRAILAGTKTQTRRVLKPQPSGGARISPFFPSYLEDGHGKEIPLRFDIGDQLWVREAWMTSPKGPSSMILSARDTSMIFYKADGHDYRSWRPSIHMPRWASRITLEVTGVRVERVHSISETDAMAEGCDGDKIYMGHGDMEIISPSAQYAELWDSINAKRGYPWESNPWVWVIEFKRKESNP